MAVTDLIPRGTDATFSITVKDQDGTVVDLDTTIEIVVRVLDESGNTIQAYNKAGTGGFQALDIDDPSSGILEVHLNAAQTELAPIGIMNAELTASFANVNFDDNTQDLGFLIKNLAKITASTTVNDI